MFLDHRPSFVSFEKVLYLTRSGISQRAAASGPVHPMGVFLGPCGFLMAFPLGSVAAPESSIR